MVVLSLARSCAADRRGLSLYGRVPARARLERARSEPVSAMIGTGAIGEILRICSGRGLPRRQRNRSGAPVYRRCPRIPEVLPRGHLATPSRRPRRSGPLRAAHAPVRTRCGEARHGLRRAHRRRGMRRHGREGCDGGRRAARLRPDRSSAPCRAQTRRA